MPIAFESKYSLPPEYEIPLEINYDYMAHELMVNYGITKEQAWKMTELDYVKMVAFGNLNKLRQEYIDNNRTQN